MFKFFVKHANGQQTNLKTNNIFEAQREAKSFVRNGAELFVVHPNNTIGKFCF